MASPSCPRSHLAALLRQLSTLARARGRQLLEAPLPEPLPIASHGLGAPDSAPSSAISCLARALLAAAVASAAAASPSLNEAPAGPPSADSGPVDAAEVRAAVTSLWASLDEQLHRLDAAQPHGQALPRIPQPEVEVLDGQVTVSFAVPQALDVPGAAAELRRRLAAPRPGVRSGGGSVFGSASTSEASSSGPQGVARRLRRSSGDPDDALAVDVLEPYDPSEPAIFEFRGACTRKNLELVTAVMRSAAQPRGAGAGAGARPRPRGRAGTAIPPWFGNLGGDEELEAGMEHFFGPLRELMQEFERLHGTDQPFGGGVGGWGGGAGGVFPGGGADGGERDTEPTPLRRPPKRFDDWQQGPQGAPGQRASAADAATAAAVRKLQDMGCQVFVPSETEERDGTTRRKDHTKVDWGQLAGYEEQKSAIEDCLLLPLVRPEVYDSVARGTREKFAPNRPRAVLLAGPPGTGKTSAARVIASQAAVPLVYIPLESVVSKWYGEAEKKLAAALEAANTIPDGCIVFLDELDALATARGGEMHEATRRLLGVLLRHMDGFDASKRSVIVGATNRPQDLDPALLSRFSANVEFGLPGEGCRKDIVRQYAHHLGDAELAALAAATPGMAGRDLRDVCEQAERRWAARIIRGQAREGELPPVAEYLAAADARLREMAQGRVGTVPALKLKPRALG